MASSASPSRKNKRNTAKQEKDAGRQETLESILTGKADKKALEKAEEKANKDKDREARMSSRGGSTVTSPKGTPRKESDDIVEKEEKDVLPSDDIKGEGAEEGEEKSGGKIEAKDLKKMRIRMDRYVDLLNFDNIPAMDGTVLRKALIEIHLLIDECLIVINKNLRWVKIR